MSIVEGTSDQRSAVPSDFALKMMNTVHKTILKASFGKVGWAAMGMPVVELTTIGRKSGQPRTTMLTSPLEDKGKTVLVASRGGDDHHPAWFLNLQANPEVEVRIGGGPKKKMHARIATGEERADLYKRLGAAHDNYAGYQRSTKRQIPVIVLEPID